MKQIRIKQAEEGDLITILELQKHAFMMVAESMNKYDLPPLLQTWEDIYQEYEKGIILKYTSESGQIIGSIRGYTDDNQTCHIGKLIVHPNFQNKGIGKELMYEIETYFPYCHKFTLFTGEETPNTLHLYNKVGYHTVCKKDMSGITMIIMEKEKIINKYMPGDYHDVFSIEIQDNRLSPREIISTFFEYNPAWIQALYKIRSYIVKPFGIETKPFQTKELLIEENTQEAVIQNDDKHLLFYIDISIKSIKGNKQTIEITTLVKYHNWLRKAYFLFIKPFHRLIVPIGLRKVLNKNKYRQTENR